MLEYEQNKSTKGKYSHVDNTLVWLTVWLKDSMIKSLANIKVDVLLVFCNSNKNWLEIWSLDHKIQDGM